MTNHKACLFDMDGVITTNSEILWLEYKTDFYNELLDAERYEKMKPQFIGLTNEDIYDNILERIVKYPKDKFMKKIDEIEKQVYEDVNIDVKNLHAAVVHLKNNGFKIGIVTSSSQWAVDTVLSKLPASLAKNFSLVVAMSSRPDLKRKPHPDGYIEAMLQMNVTPQRTIVVEDSNIGIQAAKATGALTIGLKQYLIKGYVQTGADISIENMSDLIKLFDLLG